ncbi:exopolysaccharide transport family protein [Chryseolinea lacunae]|uniref:Tyrosine-protein kinase G-rich domain-containing protein n=1 Tax=Chryseolinea lacunae TaxID=2801331 RepID=A0ABS1L4J4_9BACT|nr:GNVR domain-containing protein [Chryseolinea lacunae]MBL0745837.1 hypothetical protein [Chryseolinea lacunae]
MEENFRILKPYVRGFPLIVLAMALAVLAANKYLGYVTPLYESTVKLKLADVNEGVPSSNLFKDLDVFANANKIAGEIELMKSSVMIGKVLDSLDFDLEIYRIGSVRKVELYHESPFLIHCHFTDARLFDKTIGLTVHSAQAYTLAVPGEPKAFAGTFGKPLALPGGDVLLELNAPLLAQRASLSIVDRYAFEVMSREKLYTKIIKNLDVVSIDKDVPVIRINFKSPIPEKAARLVNQMARSYVNDYIDTKYKAARTTVMFLEERIADIARRLAQSENTIQKYRDNRDIVNIHQETETDLRKISQLKIQQTNLKMNLDAIEALNAYIADGKQNFLDLAPNFEAFTDLLSTEIIKKLKQLQSDKKDLLLVFTPEDERVKVVDMKMKDLTSYLVESIDNTYKNIRVKYDRLTTDIAEAEKVFIGVPEKEKMLTILNREFEIYQRSYNFLNEKKIEAEIAQAARIAFHRIISPALPSHVPVSPNRPIIIIVSALAGMFGAIALIFVVHMAKAKVNDVHNIERNSPIEIALLTPFLEKPAGLREHFLREAIQLELKGVAMPKTILVLTSGDRREGRSFHAWHLAQAFAAQGRSVLLVDVGDRLAAQCTETTGEGVRNTTCGGVHGLSLSDPKYSAYTKASLRQHLEQHAAAFDLVVVNNEPLKGETRALLLMSVADANLFVLDSRRTPQSQILNVSLLQKEFSLPNMWFILNRCGYNPNVLRQLIAFVRAQITNYRSR